MYKKPNDIEALMKRKLMQMVYFVSISVLISE